MVANIDLIVIKNITNYKIDVKGNYDGQKLKENHLHSLSIQVRWLTKRIENHLLGNHFFSNAKALIIAGLFFEGQEANDWFKKGFEIF